MAGLDHRAAPLPTHHLSPLCQEIPTIRQLSDFPVVVPTTPFRPLREDLLHALHRPLLPRAHLVRMNLVPHSAWIVLSPRSASSATFALKSALNRRRVLIAHPSFSRWNTP